MKLKLLKSLMKVMQMRWKVVLMITILMIINHKCLLLWSKKRHLYSKIALMSKSRQKTLKWIINSKKRLQQPSNNKAKIIKLRKWKRKRKKRTLQINLNRRQTKWTEVKQCPLKGWGLCETAVMKDKASLKIASTLFSKVKSCWK